MNQLTARLAICPRRSQDAVAEPAPDDLLVLDVTSGEYFAVGPVGAFVWERLDGEHSLAEISRQVADGWRIDPERAKSDVLEFASQLATRGLMASSGSS